MYNISLTNGPSLAGYCGGMTLESVVLPKEHTPRTWEGASRVLVPRDRVADRILEDTTDHHLFRIGNLDSFGDAASSVYVPRKSYRGNDLYEQFDTHFDEDSAEADEYFTYFLEGISDRFYGISSVGTGKRPRYSYIGNSGGQRAVIFAKSPSAHAVSGGGKISREAVQGSLRLMYKLYKWSTPSSTPEWARPVPNALPKRVVRLTPERAKSLGANPNMLRSLWITALPTFVNPEYPHEACAMIISCSSSSVAHRRGADDSGS